MGKVNPFAESGPVFSPPGSESPADSVTAGAGVEMHWHALHMAPAFRFTRWGAGNSVTSSEFARNEAALLVGFSFGGPALAAR